MNQPKQRLATVLLVLALGLAALAHAEVNISGPRSLELRPGETRVVEYTVTNTGSEPVQATIFYNDYAQMPDGSLVHIPAQSLPASLFHVASFDRLTYALEPQESARVPLRIELPDAPLGGYWGVVGVETPPPPTPEGENVVGFNIRYAMVTALDVAGVARDQVTLRNVGTVPTANGPALAVTLENSGTGYERYELEITFQSPDGQSVTTKSNSVILPGLTVDLAIPVPAELPAGTYGVFAILSHDGARSEAVGTIVVP